MSTKRGFLSHDEFLRLEKNTLRQSYGERFGAAQKLLYYFSWFGNSISVFLAYFFVRELFMGIVTAGSGMLLMSFLVVVFLSFFELLKRYIFRQFSIDLIQSRTDDEKKTSSILVVGVFAVIIISFYLSLNGAQEFINREKTVTTQTEVVVNNKADSINAYYMTTYINALQEENKKLTDQNNQYAEISKEKYARMYGDLIKQNNIKIDKNLENIRYYEDQRDVKIAGITQAEQTKLDSFKSENKYNVLIFILLSFIIESFILFGIYFTQFFNCKILAEYRTEVMDTPTFKKWMMYDKMMDIFFEGMDINDELPTAAAIQEIAKLSDLKSSNYDLERFFKMTTYLKIIERRGNKRLLAMNLDTAKKMLRAYYKIK
jgi:hypothetical protein